MKFQVWQQVSTDGGTNYVNGYGPIPIKGVDIIKAVDTMVEKSAEPTTATLNFADQSAIIETANNIRYSITRDHEAEARAAAEAEERKKAAEAEAAKNANGTPAADASEAAPETATTTASASAGRSRNR